MTDQAATMQARALGVRLRQARKRAGWSQTELGRRVMLTRVSIANMERGRHMPQPKNLLRICAQLGVTEAWLRHGGATPEATGNPMTETMRNAITVALEELHGIQEKIAETMNVLRLSRPPDLRSPVEDDPVTDR